MKFLVVSSPEGLMYTQAIITVMMIVEVSQQLQSHRQLATRMVCGLGSMIRLPLLRGRVCGLAALVSSGNLLGVMHASGSALYLALSPHVWHAYKIQETCQKIPEKSEQLGWGRTKATRCGRIDQIARFQTFWSQNPFPLLKLTEDPETFPYVFGLLFWCLTIEHSWILISASASNLLYCYFGWNRWRKVGLMQIHSSKGGVF